MKPVRWTNLRQMAKSPAHYKYFTENPVEQTPAMQLGALVHRIAFGPFDTIAVYDGVRRGKAWEAFRAKNLGKMLVTEKEMDLAEGIYSAVEHDGAACEVLWGNDNKYEQRCEWQVNGVSCFGTPDVLAPEYITDLKVVGQDLAEPFRFARHARKMLWPEQLCWYDTGTGCGRDLYLVAVEKTPPHPVTVHKLTKDAIEAGNRHWRLLFERLQACIESDQWPGYVQAAVPLDVDEPLALTIEGEEVSL